MTHFTTLVIKHESRDLEEVLAPYKEGTLGEVPAEYLEFYADDDCDVDPEVGERGFWANPDAQWDWYEVGGRWDKALAGRNHLPLSRWDEVPEGFRTHAVVTPDGEWYEAGMRGWFGWSSEGAEEAATFRERFVDPYREVPGMEAVLVDCHI